MISMISMRSNAATWSVRRRFDGRRRCGLDGRRGRARRSGRSGSRCGPARCGVCALSAFVAIVRAATVTSAAGCERGDRESSDDDCDLEHVHVVASSPHHGDAAFAANDGNMKNREVVDLALRRQTSGFLQRRPPKRPKSVSFEHSSAPFSIANAAICASVVRFAAAPVARSRENAIST